MFPARRWRAPAPPSGARALSLVILTAAALLARHAAPASAQAARASVARKDASSAACLSSSPIFAPAAPDSAHLLYVEQESVTPHADGRILVAGNPVFLWGKTGAGYEFVEQDSIIGMVISAPSSVRSVVSPLPHHHVQGVRSVALPGGWWLVTFAEVVPTKPGVNPVVLHYWAAETDGTSWRGLTQLPAVVDSLSSAEASALVWRAGRAMLAVPGDRGRFPYRDPRVVTYTRVGGKWSAASAALGRRTYVAVALTRTRDLLAVVRPDSTEREDDNSLFMYYKSPADSTWSVAYRLVRGYRSPVRDPFFSGEDDSLTLSWRVTSFEDRSRTAWFTRLNAMGDTLGASMRVADEAELLYGAQRGRRGVLIASDRGNPFATHRFVEYDGISTPAAPRVTSTKYRGLLGLALTRDYAVVIGSQTSDTRGEPAVFSMIQSHPWRCH